MRSIRGPIFYNRNRVARSGKMKKMLSIVKINMMLEPADPSMQARLVALYQSGSVAQICRGF